LDLKANLDDLKGVSEDLLIQLVRFSLEV
jgi:hypothetical protein